jgi:AcrR family transcriptional regulator
VLSQSERIMRATAQAAVEGGYQSLRVSEISKAAGTSNQTFYQHFESKQEAFLAAFDTLAQEAFEVTAAAFSPTDDWLQAGTAAILALLEHIAGNSLFRELVFFELPAAGPKARERADQMLIPFTAFMQPQPFPSRANTRPPAVAIEAIAGGIWAVVQHEISSGRSESLPELAPEILDFILLPFDLEPES